MNIFCCILVTFFFFVLFSEHVSCVSSFDQQLMEQSFETEEKFSILHIPNCNDRVTQCIQHLDDHTKACKQMWKTSLGRNYGVCSDRKHVKTAYEAWSKTSALWRQSFVECLTSPLIQSPAASRDRHLASPKKSARNYRESEITTNRFAFLIPQNHHAHHFDNVVECWTTLGDHKTKCEEQYALCEQYKRCLAISKVELNPLSKRLSDLAKQSQKKSRTYFDRLGTCLEANATVPGPVSGRYNQKQLMKSKRYYHQTQHQ
uniref:Uncharacterized protein n=1 Tax=Romanomermis culicivorax TaxID=13658 RepID=A0A915L0V6_ROMCU